MSMLLGHVDGVAAAVVVLRRHSPFPRPRYVKVGALRDKGFIVTHTPSMHNVLHVSIHPPQDADGLPLDWDDDVASMFRACFDG